MEMPVPGDTHVLWIVPSAWEDDLMVLPLHPPIPLRQWLTILREEGMQVVVLPGGSGIVGGPAGGGRVVAVEAANGRHYFALPPAALPVLRGLVSADEFEALMADGETGGDERGRTRGGDDAGAG